MNFLPVLLVLIHAGDSDTAPRGKFDDMEDDIPFN